MPCVIEKWHLRKWNVTSSEQWWRKKWSAESGRLSDDVKWRCGRRWAVPNFPPGCEVGVQWGDPAWLAGVENSRNTPGLPLSGQCCSLFQLLFHTVMFYKEGPPNGQTLYWCTYTHSHTPHMAKCQYNTCKKWFWGSFPLIKCEAICFSYFLNWWRNPVF